MIITGELAFETAGNTDIIDITPELQEQLRDSGLQAGIVTIFCPGATGGLTTIEWEDGVLADVRQVLDEVAPPDRDYRHNLRGDDNGSAHVRATLMGPSLTIPFAGGRLTLGIWQHVVFFDFDTRPRSRRLVVQVMGE
jgi:secondary thiamine-phosphate synthase enzyme